MEQTRRESLCVFSCQPLAGQGPAPFRRVVVVVVVFCHAQLGRLGRHSGRREDVEGESENRDSRER